MSAPSKTPIMLRLSSLMLVVYLLLGLAFFVALGNDALDDKNDFEFFSDSTTYEKAAEDRLAVSEGPIGLIALDANYLGPITILRLVDSNRYGVIAVNIMLFIVAISMIARTRPIRRDILILCLALNPLTLSSLLSVNKEILTILSVVLVNYAVGKRSFTAFAISVAVGLLARWQMSLVCVVAYLSCTMLNPFWRNRLVTILLLLVAISIAYPIARPFLSAFDTILEEASQTNEGGGFFFRLMDLQNEAAYILAFIPKTLHLMFGILLRLDRFGEMEVFHNYTWVAMHSAAMLVLTGAVVATRRLTLRTDSVYIAIIYCSVVALSPIYAPRYFYPVHVLLAITLALPRPARPDATSLAALSTRQPK